MEKSLGVHTLHFKIAFGYDKRLEKLSDYYQVDMLGVQSKSINLRAKQSPGRLGVLTD